MATTWADWYHGSNQQLEKTNGVSHHDYKDSYATSNNFGSDSLGKVSDTGDVRPEDVEVKLAHRFRVKFGVFDQVGHHVKTITRPNVTFAEVEVAKLNSKVYFAGRKTQDACSIEFDDSLDNSVTRAVQSQMQSQTNFDNNMHAQSGASYFFHIITEELKGDGSYLMAWYYHKCVVMSADFGTLDYSDDAATAAITLSIRYSNFTTHINGGQKGSRNFYPTDLGAGYMAQRDSSKFGG